VTRLATAVPASDSTRMGLRPTRSESRPQIGEKMSCAPEKAAMRALAVTALAPNCLA
jgi:hypothetical protein